MVSKRYISTPADHPCRYHYTSFTPDSWRKFSTELFFRYQRSEHALVLALMEMVVGGVSTRKVAPITDELCGTEFMGKKEVPKRSGKLHL